MKVYIDLPEGIIDKVSAVAIRKGHKIVLFEECDVAIMDIRNRVIDALEWGQKIVIQFVVNDSITPCHDLQESDIYGDRIFICYPTNDADQGGSGSIFEALDRISNTKKKKR